MILDMKSKVLGFAFVFGLFFVRAQTVWAATCPPTELTASQATSMSLSATAPEIATMSCQTLTAEVTPTQRLQKCIPGACPGDSTVMCCLPGTGAVRGLAPAAPASPATGGSGGALKLQMPTCTENGNCGLDDILQMGVNFANFLFGISGAIFLAIFVYAGFKYIFFASNSGTAKSSKDMLVNATIGIVLMFGASALVTTIYNAARTNSGADGSSVPAGSERCASAYQGYSCKPLTVAWSDVTARKEEIASKGCKPTLCSGELVCCPSSATPDRTGAVGGVTGTCSCGLAGGAFGSAIAREIATPEQIAQVRTACTGQGGTFSESPLSCVGPSTEAECTLLNTAIHSQTSLASCSWR